MNSMKKILVTGGAGYIGSHTVIEILLAGGDVVIVDNFCNSTPEAVRRVEAISNRKIELVELDIRDRAALADVFRRHDISAVIHFAGHKAVGESVRNPLKYYDNNIGGTLVLLDVMQEFSVKTIVFSSSATVYGDPASVPIREDFPLSATNAYGRSKLITEQMLQDIHRSDPGWNIALLRYFNPVGAHASGQIGEDPNGVPDNLMPYISQVAVGRREALNVFGGDYPTPDGTGVRDYIHVVDLARGHVKALQALDPVEPGPGALLTVNLGTGRGYSVLEMIQAFEKASGARVPYNIVDRRAGDIAACYADPSLAEQLLEWSAEYDLEQMCADTWRWQSRNPQGYAKHAAEGGSG